MGLAIYGFLAVGTALFFGGDRSNAGNDCLGARDHDERATDETDALRPERDIDLEDVSENAGEAVRGVVFVLDRGREDAFEDARWGCFNGVFMGAPDVTLVVLWREANVEPWSVAELTLGVGPDTERLEEMLDTLLVERGRVPVDDPEVVRLLGGGGAR